MLPVSMVQVQDSLKRSSRICSIPYRCEDMRDDEGGRQRDMFFLESSKIRRFESLFHSPTFSHDMIPYVSFSLRFSCIHITSYQARTLCRVVTLRALGFFKDAAFLDVECVCFDQSVTRG